MVPACSLLDKVQEVVQRTSKTRTPEGRRRSCTVVRYSTYVVPSRLCIVCAREAIYVERRYIQNTTRFALQNTARYKNNALKERGGLYRLVLSYDLTLQKTPVEPL